MVVRALWSALLTAATDVPSVSATSAADQPSTSIRSSTARCFGAKCWRAATNARRMLSRSMASSPGSAPARNPRASRLAPLPPLRASPGPPVGQLVQAHVGRYSVQPSPQRCSLVESIEASPGADHRLLGSIVGVDY